MSAETRASKAQYRIAVAGDLDKHYHKATQPISTVDEAVQYLKDKELSGTFDIVTVRRVYVEIKKSVSSKFVELPASSDNTQTPPPAPPAPPQDEE
jgi:hypothetical protein